MQKHKSCSVVESYGKTLKILIQLIIYNTYFVATDYSVLFDLHLRVCSKNALNCKNGTQNSTVLTENHCFFEIT